MVMPRHRTVTDPLTESCDRFVAGFIRRANGNFVQTVDGVRCTVFFKRGRWGWVVDDHGVTRWSRWEGFDSEGEAAGDLWAELYCPFLPT